MQVRFHGHVLLWALFTQAIHDKIRSGPVLVLVASGSWQLPAQVRFNGTFRAINPRKSASAGRSRATRRFPENMP